MAALRCAKAKMSGRATPAGRQAGQSGSVLSSGADDVPSSAPTHLMPDKPVSIGFAAVDIHGDVHPDSRQAEQGEGEACQQHEEPAGKPERIAAVHLDQILIEDTVKRVACAHRIGAVTVRVAWA